MLLESYKLFTGGVNKTVLILSEMQFELLRLFLKQTETSHAHQTLVLSLKQLIFRYPALHPPPPT